MNPAQIRMLILTSKWDDTASLPFTAENIHAAVVQIALGKKILDRKPEHVAATSLEKAIHDVVWELILEGVFAPGSRLNSSNALPQLHITEHGKKVLEAGQMTPHDPDGYLERIKKDSPAVDPITLLYLGEALQTFRRGNQLATAVMVGVAAENVLLKLADAVKGALDSTTKVANFEKATKSNKAKAWHDEVLIRLRSSNNPLPPSLTQVIENHVDGAFQLIRVSRNEAGHPTGRLMHRDETHALLLLFPLYCKTAHELIDWLATNKI
jgi:hypothetical protein